MSSDIKAKYIAEAGPTTGKEWYDIKQVMKKLNCSRRFVNSLTELGTLHPVRLGRHLRFIPEEIEELMARLEKEALAQ